MANENKEKDAAKVPAAAETAEQPKKKKMTVVFRRQNSQQDSLKTRPAGMKRPAPKAPEKPARPVRPVKPAAGTEKTSLKPAPAKKPVQPAAAEAEKPAVKKPAAKKAEAVPAVQEAAAVPEAGTKKTAAKPAPKAAETPVEKPEAGQQAPEAARPEAKEAEPQAPVQEKPRFVDMSLVRAADRQTGRSSGGRSGAGGRSGGYRTGTGEGTRPGDRGAGRGGARPGGPQGAAGQERGGRPAPAGGRGAAGGRGMAGGGRGAAPAAGKGGFGDVVAAKPAGKGGKGGSRNRYDNKKTYGEDSRRGVKSGGRDLQKPAKPVQKQPEKPQIREIILPEVLTVRELADKMKLQPSAIVKKLFMAGKIVTVNQEIDYDTAAEIALEYEVLAEKEVKVNVIEELLKDTQVDPPESLKPRPPVVCVMGHVDHGKTSLLDAIRKTSVSAREAGGITQHIGASVAEINGRSITFLDTPGHEAFTAMRMRGAQSTDIAVLVVAADDGVMPQTVEAINHAKAAGVEIMVAINKIDKPGANIDKVKQELSEYEIISEEWGGKNVFVPVSAKTGEGIDDLLEAIILLSEMLELKANPDRSVRGLVIEARLDKGKGPVATLLVQKGTLHVGDFVASGPCYGHVRAMMDDKGRNVKEVGPGYPVEIQGLTDIPNAGEIMISTPTEKDAKNYAQTFISEGKKSLIDETRSRMSLDDLYSQIQAGKVKDFDIVLKADVQGSVEALKQSLEKLSNDEVAVRIIHSGVGAISESDVTLASVSNAVIIGFNVKIDALARSVAEQEKVDVRLYRVIYQVIEDVEAALKGMLEPIFEERIVGHAVVRQTFRASGIGTIAGCYVTDGKITRNSKCRVSRGGEQLFDGPIASLKRFKDDVKEVAAGYEFGLVLDGHQDYQEDDTIEAYEMVEVSRS